MIIIRNRHHTETELDYKGKIWYHKVNTIRSETNARSTNILKLAQLVFIISDDHHMKSTFKSCNVVPLLSWYE